MKKYFYEEARAELVKKYNNEADSAKALANSDKVVLKGKDLKNMLDTKLVRAITRDNGDIKFVPFQPKGSPSISLLHAFNRELDISLQIITLLLTRSEKSIII